MNHLYFFSIYSVWLFCVIATKKEVGVLFKDKVVFIVKIIMSDPNPHDETSRISITQKAPQVNIRGACF